MQIEMPILSSEHTSPVNLEGDRDEDSLSPRSTENEPASPRSEETSTLQLENEKLEESQRSSLKRQVLSKLTAETRLVEVFVKTNASETNQMVNVNFLLLNQLDLLKDLDKCVN